MLGLAACICIAGVSIGIACGFITMSIIRLPVGLMVSLAGIRKAGVMFYIGFLMNDWVEVVDWVNHPQHGVCMRFYYEDRYIIVCSDYRFGKMHAHVFMPYGIEFISDNSYLMLEAYFEMRLEKVQRKRRLSIFPRVAAFELHVSSYRDAEVQGFKEKIESKILGELWPKKTSRS